MSFSRTLALCSAELLASLAAMDAPRCVLLIARMDAHHLDDGEVDPYRHVGKGPPHLPNHPPVAGDLGFHLPQRRDAHILSAIRDARFAGGISCPRCSSRDVQKWGGFSGRRRYRCRGCGRTFSDLTGTPAAYSKKLHLWSDFARCMEAGLSVRASAARVGVQPSTTFRWRHRFCNGLRGQDSDTVFGWIEVCGLWLPYSAKGSRDLRWPARRRGIRDRLNFRFQHGGVMIRFAADRLGAVVDEVGPPLGADSSEWLTFVQRHIRGRFDLVASHNPYSPVSVMLHGIRGIAIRPARKIPYGQAEPMLHLTTVLRYRCRFESWMLRFRGVATKYLANYLIWHRRVDEHRRKGFEASALRWPRSARAGSMPEARYT